MTTDHSCCSQILERLNRNLQDTGISVSIPSQRLDSFGVDMALQVAGEKKGGLTFAPEAGSQRMRDIINRTLPRKTWSALRVPPSKPDGVAVSFTS